jgi:hypothetical protein
VTLQSLTDLGRLITYRRFLDLLRHMVGLLGRVISPSQGLYLHRTTPTQKDADKHPCLERDSNPRSQQTTGHDPRLRPHGHCDRHMYTQTHIYKIPEGYILQQHLSYCLCILVQNTLSHEIMFATETHLNNFVNLTKYVLHVYILFIILL